MASWAPNDLVSDADLTAYERKILTQFGVSDWQMRRQKVLEDWLFPQLEAKGFLPQRFRTRFDINAVLSVTSAVTTDQTSAARTVGGLNLNTILATSSDLIYIGSVEPFRGISVRMQDAVNAVAATLTLQVWADTWKTPTSINDGTKLVSGTPFSSGGAITWTMPDALVERSLQSTGPYYWAKLALSTAPTASTAIGPIGVIRRSRLCAPAALRTLSLIFREAPTSSDGPWDEKAEYYEVEADKAFARVIEHIGGEFDTDADDQVDADEAVQTSDSVSGGGWTWERG